MGMSLGVENGVRSRGVGGGRFWIRNPELQRGGDSCGTWGEKQPRLVSLMTRGWEEETGGLVDHFVL